MCTSQFPIKLIFVKKIFKNFSKKSRNRHILSNRHKNFSNYQRAEFLFFIVNKELFFNSEKLEFRVELCRKKKLALQVHV